MSTQAMKLPESIYCEIGDNVWTILPWLKDQIKKKLAEGGGITVCTNRRAGKTTAIIELCYQFGVEECLIIAPNPAMVVHTQRKCGRLRGTPIPQVCSAWEFYQRQRGRPSPKYVFVDDADQFSRHSIDEIRATLRIFAMTSNLRAVSV